MQSGVHREERMVKSEVFCRSLETIAQGSVAVEEDRARVESVMLRRVERRDKICWMMVEGRDGGGFPSCHYGLQQNGPGRWQALCLGRRICTATWGASV